jgi:hypothetical protein
VLPGLHRGLLLALATTALRAGALAPTRAICFWNASAMVNLMQQQSGVAEQHHVRAVLWLISKDLDKPSRRRTLVRMLTPNHPSAT